MPSRVSARRTGSETSGDRVWRGETFAALELERNEDWPTLLRIGDSLLWVEAGDLPPHVQPWVGSVYVYVRDVDATYARVIQRGARSISAPENKRYLLPAAR